MIFYLDIYILQTSCHLKWSCFYFYVFIFSRWSKSEPRLMFAGVKSFLEVVCPRGFTSILKATGSLCSPQAPEACYKTSATSVPKLSVSSSLLLILLHMVQSRKAQTNRQRATTSHTTVLKRTKHSRFLSMSTEQLTHTNTHTHTLVFVQ